MQKKKSSTQPQYNCMSYTVCVVLCIEEVQASSLRPVDSRDRAPQLQVCTQMSWIKLMILSATGFAKLHILQQASRMRFKSADLKPWRKSWKKWVFDGSRFASLCLIHTWTQKIHWILWPQWRLTVEFPSAAECLVIPRWSHMKGSMSTLLHCCSFMWLQTQQSTFGGTAPCFFFFFYLICWLVDITSTPLHVTPLY